MKILKEISLDENLIAYIQKLDYEVNGYRDVLCTIFKNEVINDTAYSNFLEKYWQTNMELRCALDELLVQYGGEFIKEHKIYARILYNLNLLQLVEVEA